MSFSPLDSDLFGPLFTTDAMRACFSDRAWISSMLAVEAALARSESRFGLAPDAIGSGDRGDPARMISTSPRWAGVRPWPACRRSHSSRPCRRG